MISRILYALEHGVQYLKKHPQLLLTIFLIILIPVAFLVSGQQFLKAGQEQLNRTQKDRIGIMHDVFASLVERTGYDAKLLQEEITDLAELNPDFTQFRIVVLTDNKLIPIAALDTERIGQAETETDLFDYAAIRDDETVIFEFFKGSERTWQAFRMVRAADGTVFYVFTENSLQATDQLFSNQINRAYWWLLGLLLLVLFFVVRHVRMIDYSYLYRETKKANELKDLFTNMIAHELRAPLTAINGYASMVVEHKDASVHSKEYALRIGKATERLLTIVNDLLDVARIQSGKLKVEEQTYNVSAVIAAVVNEINASAAQKNITLNTTGTDVPLEITGDGKRMHQALINLVSNAIKYTKQGTITISAELKYDVVEIRVQDTGMGISAEDQKELFAPFFRVSGDEVSAITGTGLGMWITKQLIELMGGTIAVESIKGVGTHVVIRFKQK